jgi:hypothetical protein
MSLYNFGSGFLYGIPTADSTGAAIANPTPQKFGVLQDVAVDFSFENKMLYGQNQFPVAVGRGKGKAGIKAKYAQIAGRNFNDMFFGQTNVVSGVSTVNDLTGKAIPSTPFTITATTTNTATTIQIPNSGTWVRDLGVLNASGQMMTRVASAPATGQYTVAAGVYVFAAADAALIVYINYEYSYTSTLAKNFTVVNQAMGYAPTFMCVLNSQYNGGSIHLRFPACISNKLSLALKNDDFTIPELDIDAFADASGNVALLGTSE